MRISDWSSDVCSSDLVALTLDRAVIADLIAAMPAASIGAAAGGHQGPGFAVSAVTRQLIEAWSGLLALLDQPDDIAMLAPLREREILYRLDRKSTRLNSSH